MVPNREFQEYSLIAIGAVQGGGCLLAGNLPSPASTSGQHVNETTQRWEAEVLSCLQDNRAVGNSRLAHMDVLSVS